MVFIPRVFKVAWVSLWPERPARYRDTGSMARRGRRRGGLHAAMGRKRAVAVAASVTVAATEDLVQESEPEEEQQPQDEPSELRCSLTKEVKCEEPETVQALEPETSSFLFAMERDAVVKIGREFELPFKKDELKRLEVRLTAFERDAGLCN